MPSSSEWPIERFPVVGLTLDTKNVRLRGVDPYEADILAYMFDFESAMSLAKAIVAEGYFDNDLPIVTGSGTKTIVLEGNRRISALKGIANPTAVPRHKSQLEELRSRLDNDSLEALQEIRAVVAPTREAAQPILASVHTQNPKVSWPLDQQAQFYYAQLGPGITVKELQERYPAVAEKIPRFIRMAEMYELARKTELSSDELEAFVESKRFKMTVFERLYSDPRFQAVAGIGFTSGSRIKTSGSKKSRDAVMTQVIEDMHSGYVNTRFLGTQTSPQFTGYVESLSADPRPSSGGPKSGHAKKPKTPKPKKKESSTLEFSGLDFALESPATGRKLNELKDLNYVKFPNAAMDLIRTVLECVLKSYFDEVGKPVQGQGDRPAMLNDALVLALKHFEKDKALRVTLTKLKAKPKNEAEFTTSASALNAVNHNPDVFFNKDEVRDTWENVLPLLKALAAGPPSKQSDAHANK